MEKTNKTCSSCQQNLPIELFYKHGAHSDGLSTYCKECTKVYNKNIYHSKYKNNPDYKGRVKVYRERYHLKNLEKEREKNRRNHRLQKRMCIDHFGGKCACCGESRIEFLGLDHVDGDGRRHRKVIGDIIYRWLIKNNFKSTVRLRVLCHNCNMAIGFHGYCPHNREPIALTNNSSEWLLYG